MRETSPSFLPFDNVWKMRIDHPYSLVVKDRDVVWSCGQCPLDGDGRVLHPGDLLAQAGAVAGFIEQYLARMGCPVSSIGRLIVYYVKTRDGDGRALDDLFRERLGSGLVVLPVAIPHFYYDGMLIEVDVHGSTSDKRSLDLVDGGTGIRLSVIDASALAWANLIAPARPFDRHAAAGALKRLIDKAGLSREQLLADQWFLARDDSAELLAAAGQAGLCGDARSVVGIPLDGIGAAAELTFSRTPVRQDRRIVPTPSYPAAGIEILCRQSQDHFHIAAADEQGHANIVAQTGAIMEAVDLMLRDMGLGFSDVRKATTYYVSGSTADELHDNMRVRNRYYARPGPASTGLPVLAFPQSKASIRLQLMGSARTTRGR